MMMKEARRHLQERVFLVGGATGGPSVPACGEKAILGLSFRLRTFNLESSLYCFFQTVSEGEHVRAYEAPRWIPSGLCLARGLIISFSFSGEMHPHTTT